MLTNDSGLAQKLTNPKGTIKKLYHVSLSKPFKKEDFETLQKGVKIDDLYVKPTALSYVGKDYKEIGIELTNDRNRIVRRIMEFFGYNITKIDRVMFAGLTKKDLPRGKYRFLNEKEINLLKMLPA
jgi:23S rRNA pseudouridine2605 synthase